MGIWNVDVKDLVEVMADCLDEIEGDFSDEQLKEALEIMKGYPYTSDSRKKGVKWRKYLGDNGI